MNTSNTNTIDCDSLVEKVVIYFCLSKNYYVETKEERDEAIEYKDHSFYKILADSHVEAFKEIEQIKNRYKEQQEEEEEKEEQKRYEIGYKVGVKVAYNHLKKVNFNNDEVLELKTHKYKTNPIYGDGFIDGYYDELKRWNPED